MMLTAQDDRLKRRGAALSFTLLFHGALLLLFIFYKIVTPIPPFPENIAGGGELAIDLGFSDVGQGDNNDAMSMSETGVSTAAPETTPEDPLLVDDDPANAINTPDPKDKPKDKPKEKPKDKPKDQVSNGLQNAMNAWSKPGEGGQGSTGQPGNVGAPNGTPGGGGGGGGKGPGTGPGTDGTGFSLVGRSVKYKPIINEKPGVAGKVVLDIVVDAEGNVLRASQNLNLSTSMAHNLVRIATDAALKWKFDKRTTGAPEQKGTITFIFRIE